MAGFTVSKFNFDLHFEISFQFFQINIKSRLQTSGRYPFGFCQKGPHRGRFGAVS